MNRYLRLFWKRFLLSLAEAMHDRLDFAIEFLATIAIVGLNLVFFSVIFSHIPSLGGYSYQQTLLIVGFYQLMDALFHFVLTKNVRNISKFVRLGEFDQLLVQPVDVQLNLLRRFDIGQLGTMVSGLLIIGYAAHALAVPLGALLEAAFISLTLGFAFQWSVIFGSCTLGFWLIKMDHLYQLAMAVVELGKFPVTAYGPSLGSFFTFVIPLAIVATIPANLVFGQAVWQLVGIAAIVVLALFVLSRAFFFWALRSYSSVSG